MKACEAAIEENWYESAFDALYPLIYAHRTVEAAAPESAFAAAVLQLQRGEKVLDLCCGNGRHMVHLLERGVRVYGLDYSQHLLHIARATIGARAALVQADMRAIPFEGCFDAVTNFFTSFGYFTEEAENRAVAENLARALKPGGRFFIDYLNAEHLEQHLVPRSCRTQDDYEIIEERWIDPQQRRINKTTLVRTPERVLLRTGESVQLYSQAQFTDLLETAGLVVDAFYGSYSGAPAGADQPRLIAVGRKRE